MIDYFNSEDATMAWIASQVFSDIHFGRGTTEEEHKQRIKIMDEFREEIEEVKEMILSNPEFYKWDYKKQINYVANMLVDLNHEKRKNDTLTSQTIGETSMSEEINGKSK